MKISKIHVSSFGKLSNYDVELNDGANSFVFPNGYGKTTLSIFIKAMFYGLDSSSRNVETNERLKYRPFNSTVKFGGYIVFNLKGKEYKLERFFGQKESEDEIKLIDNESYKEYNAPIDIGKEIFGVDKNTFLSTTFLSQNDLFYSELSGVNDIVNLKSGNNDEFLYNKGVNNLNSKLKEYKKVGNKGLIPEIKDKIFTLKNNIDYIKRQTDSLDLFKEDLNSDLIKEKNLSEEIKNEENKLQNYANSVKNSVKAENNERLREELTELNNSKNEIEELFNGYIPSDDELSAYFTCYEDYKKSKEKSNDNIALDKKANKPLKKWSILGIILFLVGFAFIPLSYFITIAVSAVGIVLTLIFFFYKDKNFKAVDNGYYEIAQEYEKRIGDFLSRFNLAEKTEFYYSLNKIKNAKSLYFETLSKISFLEQKLKENTDDSEKSISGDLSLTEDIKLIQNNLENLRNEKEKVSYEIYNLRNRINYINDQIDELNEKTVELELSKQKLSEYEKEYEIYDLTLKFLTTANENLLAEYRKPLENSFIHYVSLISEELSKKIKIDLDYNILVDENGKTTKSAYYSKGYRVIFEICKRFALIDVLFNKEKPIIVIDDSFCDLDATNLSQAKKVVKTLSDDYQILYFTCHDSRGI